MVKLHKYLFIERFENTANSAPSSVSCGRRWCYIKTFLRFTPLKIEYFKDATELESKHWQILRRKLYGSVGYIFNIHGDTE